MKMTEASAMRRVFGQVKPDQYSAREYALTSGPLIHAKLSEGPVRAANTAINEHNRGISLVVVCERSYRVIPARQGTPINEVLHEHGKTNDYEAFLVEMFGEFNRLTDVTFNDYHGGSFTVHRGDIRERAKGLNEGQLDLSMLDSVGLSEALSWSSVFNFKTAAAAQEFKNKCKCTADWDGRSKVTLSPRNDAELRAARAVAREIDPSSIKESFQ